MKRTNMLQQMSDIEWIAILLPADSHSYWTWAEGNKSTEIMPSARWPMDQYCFPWKQLMIISAFSTIRDWNHEIIEIPQSNLCVAATAMQFFLRNQSAFFSAKWVAYAGLPREIVHYCFARSCLHKCSDIYSQLTTKKVALQGQL